MNAWAIAAAALIFVPLLVPLCTNRVLAYDDLLAFHLPIRSLYAGALGSGHSILWTSSLFGGFYLHAEGQAGALHPLHLGLYRFLPLVTALNVELTLSYAFALGGMWWFLRRRGLGPAASAVGATAFAFSGFNLLHLSHMNAIAIAAHVPWLLIGIDLLLSGSSRERAVGFAGVSLLIGSQMLLGYPQYLWISGLIGAAYSTARALELSAGRRLVHVAGAASIGVLIGGAQLLPTLDLLSQSVRANVTREFQLTFSLHPLNLLQLVSPYIFQYRVHATPEELIEHELGVYNGALATVAIFWLIGCRKRLPSRSLAMFGSALAVAGVLLALGRYGLVYEPVTLLPLVGSFRAPARYVLLLHFGLSVLLALMVEDLTRAAWHDRPSSRQLAGASIPVVLSVATAVLAWGGLIGRAARPPALVAGSGLMLAGVLLVTRAAMGSRIALLLIPVFVALDLGWWGYSYAWSNPAETIVQITSRAEPPPAFGAGTMVHDPSFDKRRNLVLLRGLKLFRPYVGLAPSRVLPVDEPRTLRLAGVEWVKAGSEWQRVAAPMPRVRLLFEALESANPARDLDTIDIARTALVSAVAPVLDSRGQGRAEIVVDQPGRLEVDIALSGRAILATTESYHQGWRGAGSERALPTLRMYGDYLGVLLEPGEYRVILTFSPASSRYGVLFSILGLFIAFGLAAVLGRSSGEEACLTDQLASSPGDRGPHDRRTISSGDIPRQ